MLRWVISIKITTKICFGKRLRRLNNETKFDSIKHKLCTESCEGSGGSALGHTLNKALLISWLVLLCIISGLCENIVHCLFYPIFLFWQVELHVEYHQCRIWTVRSHVGGSHPWSWKLGRSCQEW